MSLSSAFKTVFVEGKVPYRVDVAVNRVLLAVGSRERVLHEGGLRFHVRRLSVDENIVKNVVVSREYLPEGISIRPKDTVVDIGGNVGAFAVLAAHLGARVIVAEPDPQNLDLLRRNLALNGVSASVVPAAVSGVTGRAKLSFSEGGGAFHSTSHAGNGARVLEVQAVSLDDLFAAHDVDKCDLLKIDCEGAEYEILSSFSSAHKVRQVAMEYHALGDFSCDDLPRLSREVMDRFPHLRVVRHDCYAPRFPCGHLFLRGE